MMSVGNAVGWWDLGEDILKRHRNLRGWEGGLIHRSGIRLHRCGERDDAPPLSGMVGRNPISWLGEAKQRGR